MAVRKYEYSTPKGGWKIKIVRNGDGFVFGTIIRNGNHIVGWQNCGGNVQWDHKITHPQYISRIVSILLGIFLGRTDIENHNLEDYLKYRVEHLAR